MIINKENIAAAFTGFNTAFRKGFTGAETAFRDICMVVPSTTREELYGWLGQFPSLREWIGPRVIKNLSVHSYTVVNRKFEQTISIPRDDMEDDRYGVYGSHFTEMGRAAAEFPDKLVFDLLGKGFTELCYDGQPFFDTDHKVGSKGGDFPVQSVSNVQAGSGEPWYLLDCSREIKPMIFQERRRLDKLVSKDRDEDDNVFLDGDYIYGSDGRCNAGFGLWQLAFASRQPLTAANYEAARAAMRNMVGDEGRPLGIKPDTLVCGPNLEGAAMRILNNGTRVETVEGSPVSVQNEWAGTAKPIITSWLNA